MFLSVCFKDQDRNRSAPQAKYKANLSVSCHYILLWLVSRQNKRHETAIYQVVQAGNINVSSSNLENCMSTYATWRNFEGDFCQLGACKLGCLSPHVGRHSARDDFLLPLTTQTGNFQSIENLTTAWSLP